MTKTVVITGATRGIGLALVETYQKEGWQVIAGARNLATADKLRELSPYKIVQIDTGDEASILKAAEDLSGKVIDVVLNNAGIGAKDTLTEGTKASLLQQFEVNAVGPFLMTRAFLPHLRAAVQKNGTAKVAQISSIMGSISDNGSGSYYGYRASKAAINMINKSLSVDLKDDKIVALTLHPGWVSTEINGYSGPLQPAESAAGLFSVITSATLEDTGKFLDYAGKPREW
ncbi:hypothetical protein Poli38472_001132 [Pythium oligandrum]|uniref:Uncharacterized protein n=1 Tax=Pythium oligandrum TaxID=41045 RepID=A0A8K1CSE3_PYTOL|nr:hypothetical protein Poli38472_001132 [Pythium oligandrum]|eukprot:TMW68976.1 hypothetical protein Poli38472_001132 [Pythium oligandrum]